jgi:hypothetical protein
MSTINSADVLTPSEVVFLKADAFAHPGGLFDKFKLLDTSIEVSKKELALNAYAAAFLGDELAGGTRLELRSKKVLMGLRSTQALYAEPCSGAVAWPQYSLEARLQLLARQLQAQKGRNEVINLVYAILGEDDEDPFTFAINVIRDGLGQRGLLEKVEEKRLKVFTVRSFRLPENTADMAADRAARAQELLAGCRDGKAELWSLLTSQIDHGIQRRKKAPEVTTGSE